MGKGMGPDDWKDAADQVLEDARPGETAVLSDTANRHPGGEAKGTLAEKRGDGSTKTTKIYGDR